MFKNILTVQKIVKHCALECMRQQSGEFSVSFMFDAWVFTVNEQFLFRPLDETKSFVPTIEFICTLAELVDPVKNSGKYNFREIPVTINGVDLIPVTDFHSNLTTLIKNGWFHENAEEFYFAFEKIHPFIDGNGRVGNILFNLLNKTLNNPVMPPMWKVR